LRIISFELLPNPTTSAAPPWGVVLGYAAFVSPPLFPQAVLRRNLIRHVDDGSDPQNTTLSLGVQVSGCGALIVEENIVDLNRTSPLEHYYCPSAQYFDNQSSSGASIPGVQVNPNNTDQIVAVENELRTTVSDAEALAI
jgi:hypothetical protein